MQYTCVQMDSALLNMDMWFKLAWKTITSRSTTVIIIITFIFIIITVIIISHHHHHCHFPHQEQHVTEPSPSTSLSSLCHEEHVIVIIIIPSISSSNYQLMKLRHCLLQGLRSNQLRACAMVPVMCASKSTLLYACVSY